MIHTHYDNLQVARNASDEVIRGAYKYLSQKYHPDKQPPEAKAQSERRMKLINAAYVVLSDPAQRREHDEWIAAEEAKEQSPDPGGRESDAAEPKGAAPAGMSDEARETYARSIARGHWPVALVLSFIVASLIVGLLTAWIDPLKKWMDAHPLVAFGLLVAWILGGAGSIVGDKRKAILAKSDDDTLKHLYDRAARRRTLVVISSVILVAGALIAFAVLQTGASRTEPQTEARSETPAPVKPELDLKQPWAEFAKNAPATPAWNLKPASRQADASNETGGAKRKSVRVTNACERATVVTILYKAETDGEGKWSGMTFHFAGNEDSDLYAVPGELLRVDSGSAYWYAKSDDGALVWNASDDVPGKRFVRDGEQTDRYTMLGDTAASKYRIRLTCE